MKNYECFTFNILYSFVYRMHFIHFLSFEFCINARKSIVQSINKYNSLNLNTNILYQLR